MKKPETSVPAAPETPVPTTPETPVPSLISCAVVAVLLIAAPCAFAQGMRTDDWYRLNRVSDVQFAPDGKTLLYVSTRANRETQRHDSQIWLIAADGRSDAKLLTTGFVSMSQP